LFLITSFFSSYSRLRQLTPGNVGAGHSTGWLPFPLENSTAQQLKSNTSNNSTTKKLQVTTAMLPDITASHCQVRATVIKTERFHLDKNNHHH